MDSSQRHEIFILLTATNKECSRLDCDSLASHILLGRDQEFLGFYCFEHGKIVQENLESKLRFEKENKIKKPVQRRRRKWQGKKRSK